MLLNYPDLQVFKPIAGRHGPRDGKFVMLYPGTLNHHQGLDIAINALALAKEQLGNAELHIYGEGPARPELVRLAHESGLSDRVYFMDPLPLEQIASVMAGADVGIVPKRAAGFGNEAFSTKVLEFMACGVPVIISKTDIDAYYFTDMLVRFFTPGDAGDLARSMVWAYERRGRSNASFNPAIEFARVHSWQEHAGEYAGIIADLQGGRRSDEMKRVPVRRHEIERHV
jgi:glycosyltransferase involved in cell wall biosynthesis